MFGELRLFSCQQPPRPRLASVGFTSCSSSDFLHRRTPEAEVDLTKTSNDTVPRWMASVSSSNDSSTSRSSTGTLLSQYLTSSHPERLFSLSCSSFNSGRQRLEEQPEEELIFLVRSLRRASIHASVSNIEVNEQIHFEHNHRQVCKTR